MAKDNQQSIDGFTLRRRTPGNQNLNRSSLERPAIPHKFMRPHAERTGSESSAAPEILPQPKVVAQGGLKRSEIDESLRAVDEQTPAKPKKRRRFRMNKKFIIWTVVILLILGIGYFAGRLILSAGRVFSGNLFDLLASNVPLKQDSSGRTNILIFGTSEDDPNHGGAALADSIMVLSVDQTKNTAAMVSMPRDMWVDYGEACISGYSGKINVVYMCGAENGDESAGAAKLQSKVGEVFGLDVQYYVKVNYTVLRQAVDAVGGVTVMIDSDDPRGIYDFNTKIKLPNGPATLNGERALALARARGDGGGYGLANSNFDREKNQQALLIALRNKALSTGTLTNPVAITQLVDALGNNVRTNFSAAEIKTLAEVGTKIDASRVISISLVDKENPVVTTGAYNGQSIVRPIAGIEDYSDIQAYIKKYLLGGEIAAENATIEVLNASTQMGVAGQKADELIAAGLFNVSAKDAVHNSNVALTWYDLSKGNKPNTSAKLVSVLGQQPSKNSPPSDVQSQADFVIILGDGTN